jgi:Flp pilus assembly protein protease CpaA
MNTAITSDRCDTSSRSHSWECAKSLVVPFATALLVAACFVWSALASNWERAPLIQVLGTAAFVCLIVFEDVRHMRIPNVFTFPALAGAIALGLSLGGLDGVLNALAGAGTARALFFVPFAFRWLGAGDVKAVVVFGALWGPDPLLGMAWWRVVLGGVIAVALVAMQPGGLRDLLSRWGRSAWYSLRLWRLVYLAPSQGSAAAAGLPFAVAMGLGAAAYFAWGSPWV